MSDRDDEFTITMRCRVDGPRVGDLLYIYTTCSAVSGKIVEVRVDGELMTMVVKEDEHDS